MTLAERRPDGSVVIRDRGRGAAAAPVLLPGAQPAQPAGRRGGGAGAGLHARGRGAGRVLRDARPAPRARGRRAADRGLLQRQPDVDARGARGPRGERPGPARRRARGDARAGRSRRRRCTARSAARPARPASSCWWRWGRWGRRSPRPSRARPTRRRTPPAASRLLAGLLAPGDTVLVKGSRGVGLEVVCSALRADGEQGGRRGAGPAPDASLQAHGAASGPR